jgi:hypothetical protein
VQKFREKGGLFHPAGGEIHLQVENCVSPVSDTSYAVQPIPACCRTRTPASPAAAWYFFVFFTQIFTPRAKIYVKKDGFFHPAGGELGCSSRRLCLSSDQTERLNADRVTRVSDLSYAVGLQTGRLSTVMAGFACGSMVLFCLFSQKIHKVIFCEKDLVSSTLPEAKLVLHWMTRLT